MRTSLLIAAVLAAIATVGGCKDQAGSEFPGLGLSNASSEPPPGIFEPIPLGDVEQVQARGVLLYRMEVALRIAYEQGANVVGFPEGDAILPLVDVDPGGRSAQVAFLRWPRKGGGEELHPLDAEHWLLVSLLLSPKRVLDHELQTGTLVPKTAVYNRAFALLAAAEALQQRTPGEMYHLFTVPEVMPTGKKKRPTKLTTRVYAMSADGDGPDLEVLVDQPRKRRKKRAPEVLQIRVVHEAGALHESPLQVAGAHPAPATVARAMLEGPAVGEVPVTANGGVVYTVSTDDGRIMRP